MKIFTMCGYRCDLCEAYAPNIKIKDGRENLREVWGKYYNFEIATEDIYCDGCRAKGDDAKRIIDACQVRDCVINKGIEHCGECKDFPCDTFYTRKGLSLEGAKRKMGSDFDRDEYNEYLLAYDNGTRMLEHKTNSSALSPMDWMLWRKKKV